MGGNQRSRYLPQELVRDVLLRLAVKSVVRCKCVCKEWFTLIRDPKFAESHLELSLSAPGNGIIYEQAKPGKFSYVDLVVERGVVNNFDFNAEEIVRDSVTLKDSCNGLLLFERTLTYSHCQVRQYYVCNPITHWYLKLPLFSNSGAAFVSETSLSYDSLNQKYKVLIVWKELVPISYKCAVFTRKMKGSLCLVVTDSSHQLDLWVLNDAVKHAWSKEFSINFRLFIHKFDLSYCRFPGQFFITQHPSRPMIIFFDIHKGNVVLYDQVTDQLKLEKKYIGMRGLSSVVAHVNSFISF